MGNGAALLIAGRCIQALLTVVAIRLLTSLLSPSKVGSVYLMLSFVSFFSLFMIGPVGNYINRKLHAWYERKVLLARFRLFNLYVVGVALLAIPSILSAKLFLGLGADIPLLHFIAAVSLYVYAVTWNQTVIPSLNMLGRRGAFVAFSVLSTAFGLMFSVAIVHVVGGSAQSWLYGQAAGLFLGYILAVGVLKKQTGDDDSFGPALQVMNSKDLAAIRAFAAPLSISALFMWFQTQSYRLIVERFSGAEFLGYLVVGLGVASSLASVTESLVQQLYFPGFYRKLHGATAEGRRIALAQLADRAIPVYIVMTGFACALSQNLVRLLAAPNFQSAWKFVFVGALIELFRMTTNIFAATAHAEMKTAALVKPYLWGGGLTASAVLLTAVLGAPPVAIPIVMAAGGIAAVLIMRAYMNRLSAFQLNKKALFQSFVFSLGFLPALFFGRQENIFYALLVVIIAGLYFIFVQWRIMASGMDPSVFPRAQDAADERSPESFKAEV